MNADSRIKFLSNLGLSKHMFIRVLLPELIGITSAISYTFLQLDKNLNIIDSFDHLPNSLQSVYKYYRENLGSIFPDCHVLAKKLNEDGMVVTTSTQLLPPIFYNSEFYTEVWQPSLYHHALIAFISLSDSSSIALMFHRKETQPLFSNKEVRHLANLLPHIKAGLCTDSKTKDNTLYVDLEETGLLIFDTQNHLCFSNSHGKRLIMLAASQAYGKMETNEYFIPEELTTRIKKFSFNHELHENFEDSMIWSHTNTWGKFIFKANWLLKDKSSGNRLISVNSRRIGVGNIIA